MRTDAVTEQRLSSNPRQTTPHHEKRKIFLYYVWQCWDVHLCCRCTHPAWRRSLRPSRTPPVSLSIRHKNLTILSSLTGFRISLWQMDDLNSEPSHVGSGLFRVCVLFCFVLFCFTEKVIKILTHNNWVMIPKNWSANNRVRFFSPTNHRNHSHFSKTSRWVSRCMDRQRRFRNLDTRGNGVQRRRSKAGKSVISRLSEWSESLDIGRTLGRTVVRVGISHSVKTGDVSYSSSLTCTARLHPKNNLQRESHNPHAAPISVTWSLLIRKQTNIGTSTALSLRPASVTCASWWRVCGINPAIHMNHQHVWRACSWC